LLVSYVDFPAAEWNAMAA